MKNEIEKKEISIHKLKFVDECGNCRKERDLKIRIIAYGRCEYDEQIINLCGHCARELVKKLSEAIRK